MWKAAVKRVVIPGVLFIALARAAHQLMIVYITTTEAAKYIDLCPPKLNGPFGITYTGVEAIDSMLCKLTTFFHASFDRSIQPLVIEFGTSLPAVVILPFVEMSRNGRSRFFTWPLPILFSIYYQLKGAGLMFNIFWLVMIVSGHATMRSGPRAKIDQAYAEANLFALVIGFMVLSVLMVVLEDPIVTAIWQPFPLWMDLLRSAHLIIRPPRGERGYNTLQATFILTFVVGAAGHFYAVWPLRHDLAQVAQQLLPQLDPHKGDNLVAVVQAFLQWDMFLTFAASFLGALWFVSSIAQFFGILAWTIVGVPLFGPGAALAGVLLWREKKLYGFRPGRK